MLGQGQADGKTAMTAWTGQAGRNGLSDEAREHILSDPRSLLDDAEIMRALIAANDRAAGENVVDLRGVAMRRLEGRLDRLEDTHRNVIAAAYENMAGANLIQRAVLHLLDPASFEEFMAALHGTLPDLLRVETLHLVLESLAEDGAAAQARLGPAVLVAPAGFAEDYLSGGRAGPARPVVLRRVAPGRSAIHGQVPGVCSEAVMRLDFGPRRLPGLLVLGAEDAQQFRAGQGTDLLAFFAAAFERVMRRWLA